MRKQWAALIVMALGVLGFVVMESGRYLQAASPFFRLQPLYGKVIGVDAGHGGYDGGCVGVGTGVEEKQLNLEVALLLKEELESRGATVVMSREEDIALIDPKTTSGNKKRKELSNRIALFNAEGAEMMVSIHMNQYSDSSQRGAQVFYTNGAQEGRVLALCIQDALKDMDKSNTRTASVGEYYILNTCDAAALVECGFLSNRDDETLLMSEKHQRKLAQAIADGIGQYFENTSVQ